MFHFKLLLVIDHGSRAVHAFALVRLWDIPTLQFSERAFFAETDKWHRVLACDHWLTLMCSERYVHTLKLSGEVYCRALRCSFWLIIAWLLLNYCLYLDWDYSALASANLFIKVILNNFFCCHYHRFYYSVLYHLESWDVTSHSVDIVKVKAKVGSCRSIHRFLVVVLYYLVELALSFLHSFLSLQVVKLLECFFCKINLGLLIQLYLF